MTDVTELQTTRTSVWSRTCSVSADHNSLHPVGPVSVSVLMMGRGQRSQGLLNHTAGGGLLDLEPQRVF